MPETVVTSFLDGTYVSLACPWCGIMSSTRGMLVTSVRDKTFFTADCQADGCGLPALLRVDNSAVSADGRAAATVLPTPQVTYAPIGVPPDIARDFQEALACQAAGHHYAAALVARRVLQATARDVIGGPGANLAAEINAIPLTRLSQVLKEAAHEVRYIGNDAAHANTIDPDDVGHLVVFTEELLDALYVMPAKVAAARAKRTGPATPPAA